MNNLANQLHDVIAVNIKTGARRILDTGKTIEDAEAIVKMAIMRRGVEVEFYTTAPTGTALAAKEGQE